MILHRCTSYNHQTNVQNNYKKRTEKKGKNKQTTRIDHLASNTQQVEHQQADSK